MGSSGELVSVMFILLLAFLVFGVIYPIFEFILSRFPKARKSIYKLFDLPDDETDDEYSAEDDSEDHSREKHFFVH